MEPRWLPLDTVLHKRSSADVAAMLAPLARYARRLHRLNRLTIILSVSAAAVSVALVKPYGAWLGVAGIIFGLTAFARQQRTDMVMAAQTGLIAMGAQPAPEIALSAEATELLAACRAGERRVRFRRGETGEWTELPTALLRSAFAPLLLSVDPHVQALALWSWYGGDRLSVQFETVAAPAQTRNLLAELSALSRDRLDSVLQGAYPDGFLPADDAPREDRLIVCTIQIAHELLSKGRFNKKAELQRRIISRLRTMGVDHHGLRNTRDQVSDSWMGQLLSPTGYGPINRRIAEAMDRIRHQ